jgi:hypothetical protein
MEGSRVTAGQPFRGGLQALCDGTVTLVLRRIGRIVAGRARQLRAVDVPAGGLAGTGAAVRSSIDCLPQVMHSTVTCSCFIATSHSDLLPQ